MEQNLGKPDNIEDDGTHISYQYWEIDFLGMNGWVDVSFKKEKVDSLLFEYYNASPEHYDTVMQHYTQKYGEADHVELLSEDGASACWDLADGSKLTVSFNYASQELVDNLEITTFSKVTVTIEG